MLRLSPMTPAEFDRYLETAVESYAETHIKAGDCEPEEALMLAQADYASLLPLGLDTPNQHLLSVHVDESPQPIGMIWFEAREKRGRKSAYIFDFEIAPEWRGKGYGAATLRALESLVASMGVTRVSLNVMGWNEGAKALYEKAGFTVTGIGMTKVL
ncbi:MAG TPA: GNAT family N-acetyltransferase [Usitatibacter sp.]